MSKRRAKIVSTLGPASEGKIPELIDAGVDLFRLNFSHGSYEGHGKAIDAIRRASSKLGKPVAILQDLQGPKVRIDSLKAPSYRLARGAIFTLLSQRVVGDETCASTQHRTLYRKVALNDTILLNDGQISLRVIEISGQRIICRVMEGGILEPHKGVNVPGRDLGMPAVTRKDWDDLLFGLERGVDFVALSMVQHAKDIISVKERIEKEGKMTLVIAKLEMSAAISNIDAILRVADGVMVARGDLGVEFPPEQVPLLQKDIIRKANLAQVPVITATQMLESMVAHTRPTRAEASDVANAVLDGTDALMLSAETATGLHPIDAVRMMDRIITAAERRPSMIDNKIMAGLSVSEAVSKAACLLASEMDAKAIVTSTLSGGAALRLSKYRPQVPIIAFAPFEEVERRMSLYWGVQSRRIPMRARNHDVLKEMIEKIRREGFAKKGELLVFVAQSPHVKTIPTDLIKVYQVP